MNAEPLEVLGMSIKVDVLPNPTCLTMKLRNLPISSHVPLNWKKSIVLTVQQVEQLGQTTFFATNLQISLPSFASFACGFVDISRQLVKE